MGKSSQVRTQNSLALQPLPWSTPSRNQLTSLKKVKLIEPEVVKPIQGLKIDHLGSRNPRLHSNEILIALAITATENPDAARAMEELGNLKGSEAHSTIILTDEDKNVLRKLGINVTFDPYYQYDRLYRK